MTRCRPRHRVIGGSGDSGQLMASLIIALCITVLAFVVIALVPVGAATNEKTRSQTAADAAALGGAEEIRTSWVDVSTAPGVLQFARPPVPPVVAASGAAAATSFAAANQAAVLTYLVTPATGLVFAEVQNTYAFDPAAGFATSDATAEMDIDFAGCAWPDPLPPPPRGPPTFDRTLRCGAWDASYVVANAPPTYPTVSLIGTTRQQLFDALEPRLVR